MRWDRKGGGDRQWNKEKKWPEKGVAHIEHSRGTLERSKAVWEIRGPSCQMGKQKAPPPPQQILSLSSCYQWLSLAVRIYLQLFSLTKLKADASTGKTCWRCAMFYVNQKVVLERIIWFVSLERFLGKTCVLFYLCRSIPLERLNACGEAERRCWSTVKSNGAKDLVNTTHQDWQHGHIARKFPTGAGLPVTKIFSTVPSFLQQIFIWNELDLSTYPILLTNIHQRTRGCQIFKYQRPHLYWGFFFNF